MDHNLFRTFIEIDISTSIIDNFHIVHWIAYTAHIQWIEQSLFLNPVHKVRMHLKPDFWTPLPLYAKNGRYV